MGGPVESNVDLALGDGHIVGHIDEFGGEFSEPGCRRIRAYFGQDDDTVSW